LDQDWRAYADSANEAILRTLAHAAHELSTVASQTVLSAAELSDVRDTLEAAYAAIEGLDLDPQASASIRSALDGMQSALARYRTLGLEAFWEEWLRVLAHVIATEERAKEEGDQRADRWKPVRRAFSAFTQAAVKFARGADSITKISAAHDVLAKYLGDGAAT
jgi:hypothetical protein